MAGAQQLKGKSLTSLEIRKKVLVKTLTDNEELWGGILVFLGALFLIGSFPFYPVYLVPLLALVCGLVAYKGPPPVGVLLSALIAFPAVAFQSTLFGWMFLLIIAIIAFETFDWFQDNKNDKWAIVAALEMLVLAPFAFGESIYFGWIAIFGMVIASLHFGSRKSLSISVPSIFLILLLSATWMVQNSAFLPINLGNYGSGMTELMILKEPVSDLLNLPGEIGSALGNLMNLEQMQMIGNAIGVLFNNALILIFSDSGLLQIIVWAVVLFLISNVSGQKGSIRKFAPLLLLLILPAYYLLAMIFSYEFQLELVAAVGISVALTEGLLFAGVDISREVEERHKQKMKVFGKFGVRDMSVGGSEKSLDDVGGYNDVKQELRDSILIPLEKKDIAAAYGMKPPSGVLLFGPPGTGKTMLMRALAKDLGYNFIEVKSTEILSMWLGESEKNVAELFNDARKVAPAILFFDEIDALGKKRTGYTGDDVGPRVLSILLQEMDGAVKSKKPLLVIGATNVPQQLDPALMRPGRFDKVIYMHLPDKEGRKEIFKVHLNKVPTAEDVDLDKLAAKSERFSGADIKNVVDEATRLAAKEATMKGMIVPISMAHLMDIAKKVKPSTGLAQLDEYEKFKLDFERSVSAKEDKKEREDIVKWEDVVGLDKVKQALLETIELPLLREDLIKQFKIKPSKGILLFGPPGTGKTLIVKAASSELKASFQALSGAEIMKRGYTEAVIVIKEAFNRARENAPSIVFIDEIETFAPARGAGAMSGEIVGQLLTEMDGLKELKGVVVVAATNKPEILDSAILRPGRFDKLFYVPPPDPKGRADMFRIHLGEFVAGLKLDEIAARTDGFSGADIASICQEAKMQAVRAKLAGKDQKIDERVLLGIIAHRKPSITREMLYAYDRFKEEYGERG